MNLEIILALTILIAAVVGSGLTLLEVERRVKYRSSQYEKAMRNHPAGKGLQSEEDILNGR